MNAFTRLNDPAAVKADRVGLWKHGYRPVALCAWDSDPDRSPGKRPVGLAWQNRARQTPPEAVVRIASAVDPNTGILADGLRVVDVDIDKDPALALAIERKATEMLGETITRRRAGSPRCLMVYRAAEGEPGKITLASDNGKVEVLGHGQQFAALGRHHTGAMLEWPDGGPLDSPRELLPSVTETQLMAFLKAAAAILGDSARITGSGSAESAAAGLVGNFDDVAAALSVIPNNGPKDWEWWNKRGMAIFAATDGDGFELFRVWSELHDSFDPALCEKRWNHWTHSSPPTSIGAGSVFTWAKDACPGWQRPSVASTNGAEFDGLPLPPIEPIRSTRRLIHPADCTLATSRGYIVKHLLAPGDVGAIIGQPGGGKSILAPHIAYAIAQGRPVFGLRTKPGRTLYVAAEDFTGMKQRVHALRLEHGDAPDFAMVDTGNLRDPAAAAELRSIIADWNPLVVVIDTMGAAFAGMDENSAQDMGEVVRLAREIAASGCAVLLIHHIAKQGDGTPRGHSVLNGTLDMCLRLEPKNPMGVFPGSLLKNRNGTTDRHIAFRYAVAVLGKDDDGDEVTAPRAIEVERLVSAAPAVKLPPAAIRALDVLQTMVGPDAGQRVPEADWRARCDDERAVSTADDPESRKRVFRDAYGKLRDAGLVIAGGGMVWLAADTAPVDLPAMEESDDLTAMVDHGSGGQSGLSAGVEAGDGVSGPVAGADDGRMMLTH